MSPVLAVSLRKSADITTLLLAEMSITEDVHTPSAVLPELNEALNSLFCTENVPDPEVELDHAVVPASLVVPSARVKSSSQKTDAGVAGAAVTSAETVLAQPFTVFVTVSI